MKKVAAIFVMSPVLLMLVSFLTPGKKKIDWLSFAQMEAMYAKNPKPIIVDVYTDWCGWCKEMDSKTYSNKKVIDYIGEKYYAVKFDAESREIVEWKGKKYSYNEQYKINELAVYLLSGQLSYPTTVFLVTPDAKPAPLAGFLKPREIESPLKFFGDGFYKTKKFPEYLKRFSASW